MGSTSSPEGPIDTARKWIGHFEEEPLSQTAYAKKLKGPLKALVHLHEKKMPWSVRVFAIVHGRIPKSYLENFDDG
jgi:hypothetical protein